ncbi:MAG TPA: hypothetical protein VF868_15185 [Bacteroidia bacterium]|jgi:hypothetical protein
MIRISKILGVPDEHIDNMTRDEFEIWCHNLEWVHQLPQTLNFDVIIDGVKYLYEQDPSKWNVNQYKDLNETVKGKNEIEIIGEAHNIVAIFLRPTVKKWNWKKFFKGLLRLNFNGYQYELLPYSPNETDKRALLFQEKLPADIAYSINLFFCLFAIEFTNNSLLSSVQQLLAEVEAK